MREKCLDNVRVEATGAHEYIVLNHLGNDDLMGMNSKDLLECSLSGVTILTNAIHL